MNSRWKSSKRVFIILALTGFARLCIIAVPVISVWMGVSQQEEVQNAK
ncbi:hypothetical protein PTIM40_155 [Cyanophage P-TIM40]|uniref:Uncharacterized protein n=1 Tax=Cyanophage P-TIM40 TaxID=1589733 RepID=A0A0C5AE17_9CAUD|nr:hypothetical protein AU107_gp155 [Cyanophage P-TIM40]AJK27582.1 hypothetical protein PTIM40_155 [Cyanophage P-TIM40]